MFFQKPDLISYGLLKVRGHVYVEVTALIDDEFAFRCLPCRLDCRFHGGRKVIGSYLHQPGDTQAFCQPSGRIKTHRQENARCYPFVRFKFRGIKFLHSLHHTGGRHGGKIAGKTDGGNIVRISPQHHIHQIPPGGCP